MVFAQYKCYCRSTHFLGIFQNEFLTDKEEIKIKIVLKSHHNRPQKSGKLPPLSLFIQIQTPARINMFDIYASQEANYIWNCLWNANYKPVSHKWGFPLHVVYYCSLFESLVYKKNLCKSVIEHLVSYEKSSYMVMVIWNINR